MTRRLRVNGTVYDVASDADTPLIYVLRDELGLKGTKLGCGLEQCGACAVLVDGAPALSCVTELSAFDGADITTIEGIEASEVGRRVQQAFVDAGAAQCGYCTAGMVVAATALLQANPAPDRAAVVDALTPHLCRCGAHPRILDALARAVQAAP